MEKVIMAKERKDPADIAKEFMAKAEVSEKKDEKVEVAPKPEEVAEKPEEKNEKPTQEGSESLPDKSLVDKDNKDDKTKKRNFGAEKRINELVAELKTLRETSESRDKETAKRIESLEEEKIELQRKVGIAPENKITDELKSLEEARVRKYREEDKALPREQRREMSKDEYEAWLVEDIGSATDWLVDQKLRRQHERREDHEKLTAKTEVDKIMKAQQISKLRVEARHPELALDDVKQELRDSGMSEEAIHKKLYKENAKYRAVVDLISSDKKFAETVLMDPNGPELLEKEMLKKLKASEEQEEEAPQKESDERIMALEAKIAEMQEELNLERSREARVDIGVTSKKGATKMSAKSSPETSAQKDKVLQMLKSKGYKMTGDEYDAMLERRKGIRGADTYEQDES